jgi:ABC-type multidrug transport system fused ATPase/permease subunit
MRTLIRVWTYARRYKLYAAATLACAMITTLAGFVFPQAAGWVVDDVLVPSRADLLLPYVLLVAGGFLARDLFNSLRIWLNNTFEQLVIFDLRCDLYEALQALPLGWYDHRATGDIQTRVGEDVTSMERVLIDGIEQGVVAVLQVAGVGAILFWINWRLTLWVLVPVPILLAGAIWYTSTAYRRYGLSRRAASAMNALLIDNVQGIRQIKAYAREPQELERFAGKARDVQNATLSVMQVWAAYSPAMSFAAALGSVIVLYVGGLDALSQTGFSKGDFVKFLLFVSMFYEPIGRLHGLNQLFQAGRAAGDRVFEILDAAREPYSPRTGSSPLPQPVRGHVRYDGVGFEYREGLPVLHAVDIDAQPGATIALVGHSGAGKSTIVNLLPRFYEATSGRITIDGNEITSLGLGELRQHIGVVTQESFLFNGTVLDNLRFGKPSATAAEIEAACRAAGAWEFVSALPQALDTHVGERGVKLSVGEKQRISIARALLKNPPILILDEATASVDTATERLIQEALHRLLQGRTSFVIAHRLSTIRQAREIIVLDGGRIRERGTHDQLLALGGIYARLCRIQNLDLISDQDFERAEAPAETP